MTAPGLAIAAMLLGPPEPAQPAEPAQSAEPAGVLAEQDFRADTRRARFLESAPFDLVTGNSRQGDWALELSAGYPWQRLRVQGGLGHRVTLFGEVDSVLGRRWRPAMGVNLRWVDRPHVRMAGELLLGWQWVLAPELAARGPNGELRVRLGFPIRRVMPYLVLGSRHTLLFDRTRIDRADGTDTQWSARHAWTGWGSVGIAVAITEHVGLDFGIDLPWVDPPTPSIPGLHLGLLLGGWR